jgi:hypothetical protein
LYQRGCQGFDDAQEAAHAPVEFQYPRAEQGRLFRRVDQHQAGGHLWILQGKAPHDQTAVGMRNQNIGAWHTCCRQQGVQFIGAILDGPAGHLFPAPAKAGPIVGACRCEVGDMFLNGPPVTAGFARALLDHHRGRRPLRGHPFANQVQIASAQRNHATGRRLP